MKKLVACLVLVACAAGAAAAQGLTVWTALDGAALDVLRTDAAAFSENFGTDVEVVRLDASELTPRALAAAPEGGAGDVLVGVPHEQAAALAAGGVLADLSAYATAAYLEDLSGQARTAFVHDGALLGLPLFVEGPALLYNRELVDEVPADYDAFVALARALTDGERRGFLADVGNFYFAYGWLATHGGYVFGPGAADVGLANEGARRGADALRALVHEHGVVPAGTDYATAYGRFLAGDVAMFYTGSWGVGPAREAGIDVGVAPMPPLADGTPWRGFMSVDGVLVNRFTRAATDAMNLAKWLARAEAQVGYAEAAGRIPASRGALARVRDGGAAAGFGAALLASEPVPTAPAMGRVWGAMGAALGTITRDPGADVAAALNGAVRRIAGE